MGNGYSIKEKQKSRDSMGKGGQYKNAIRCKENAAIASKPNNNGVSNEIRKFWGQSLELPIEEGKVNYNLYKPKNEGELVYSQGTQGLTMQQSQHLITGRSGTSVIQRKPLREFTSEELFDLSEFFTGSLFDSFLAECSKLEVDDNDPLNYIRSAFREYYQYSKEKMRCEKEKANRTEIVHRGFSPSEEFKDRVFETYFSRNNPNYGGQFNYMGYVSKRLEFQLGFRSIVLLKAAAGGGYKLIKVLQCNGKEVNNIDFAALRKARVEDLGKQLLDLNKAENTGNLSLKVQLPEEYIEEKNLIACVFTKSVSGCTFAAMCDADRKYIIVMHLDQSTPVSIGELKELLKNQGDTGLMLDTLFVSKVDGKEETEKVSVIEDSFGIQQFGVSSIPNTTILERGYSTDVYAQKHDIIGLDLETMDIWGTMGSSEKEMEQQVDWILSRNTKAEAEKYVQNSINGMLDDYKNMTCDIDAKDWSKIKGNKDFRSVLLSLYVKHATKVGFKKHFVKH